MPSLATINRDRQAEARIDPPEGDYKKSSGRIFTSGYAYVEPELTGEWPFCTVDMIQAEYAAKSYRKASVDAPFIRRDAETEAA